jgi:pimeloyl-ACP methyl ester carboxylesterase
MVASNADAPRLVLLPGFDGTGELFGPFVDALRGRAAVTVVDYSRPKVSSYSDCRALAERRLPRDESYVLVGESFSGPVAVSIAAANPPGLCGLALVGSFLSSPRPALKYFSPLLPILPTHNPSDRLTDFLLLGRHATPELRARIRNAMAQVSPRTVRARLRAISQVNVTTDLSRVRVPVLYLRGTEDRLVPRRCGDEVARLAHTVRIAELPAPHMLLQCAPADSATLLLEFFTAFR